MARSPVRRVTLYTRPGCHLCEEAEDLVLQLGREQPLELELVNILSDEALYERYKWVIPVIVIDGGASLSAPIDEAAVRVALGLA